MRKILAALLFFTLFSVTLAQDSVSFGNDAIEWKVYETEAPVVAFGYLQNGIWYSTGEMVSFYDTKSTKKTPYPKLGKMPSAGIISIAVDNRGGVWFGGANGAAYLKGGNYTIYNSKKGLPSDNVNRIRVDGSKTYFCTDKGVAVYNGGSFDVFTTGNGLASNAVFDCAFDGKGGAWFATDKGVSQYNGATWKTHNTDNGVSFDEVKAIAYDSRLNHVWCAAGPMDVCSYDGKEWNGYMDIQEGIKSVMVDTQSRIWFGSSFGVMKYNGDAWITDPAKIGFPAAQVLDMFRTKEGDLLFGMERGVLHMKNPYPY